MHAPCDLLKETPCNRDITRCAPNRTPEPSTMAWKCEELRDVLDSTNRQPASPRFLVVFLNKCSWYFHVITQQKWNWLNNLSKEIDLYPNHLAACTEPHESCRFYKSSKTTKKSHQKGPDSIPFLKNSRNSRNPRNLQTTRSKALWHI